MFILFTHTINSSNKELVAYAEMKENKALLEKIMSMGFNSILKKWRVGENILKAYKELIVK